MIPDLPKIAFVVATKDRPRDLRNMLASLAGQSVRPGHGKCSSPEKFMSGIRSAVTEFGPSGEGLSR